MARYPYREIIGLYSTGLSEGKVAHLCGCSTGKAGDVVRRARELGIGWPVPAELSDDDLEQLVDPLPGFRRHPPDFPRIADDGSAATFEIRVRPGAGHIKSGVPVLHGSIGVECATGREAKTATLLTKPGSTAQLGPLKVTVPADEDEDDGGGANAGAAFAAMIAQQAAAGGDGGEEGEAAMAAAFLGGMFGGGGDGFDLEVTGDGSALATLVLVVDGKDVEPRSWMNFGRGTTYGFPAVKGDTVRVKAEFWTGRRTETVSF